MIESDDKITTQSQENAPAPQSRNASARSCMSDNGSFGAELAALSLKVAAIALSLVMLVLSVLCVAMPLSAMRVFDKLGLKERALNSGERYISSRLDAADAEEPDEDGNFIKMTETDGLSDEDMAEALDVCINLSSSLFEKSKDKGDRDSAVYFAEKLEVLTRKFASLRGVRSICQNRDAIAIANVPSPSLRPYVYDSLHENMKLNYRARAYIGETGSMLYDSGRDGDCVATIDNRAETFANTVNKNTATLINGFTHYIAQIGEYLGLKFDELGVPADLSEPYAGTHLKNTLKGNEFELLITRADGFTRVYDRLVSCFSEYANAAVFYPANTEDEKLRQLFWLKEFSTASTKLYYLGMIMHYNQVSFGVHAQEVAASYDVLHGLKYVDFRGDGNFIQISDVYTEKLNEYIKTLS